MRGLSPKFWFYDAAYANDIYDLVIDSSRFTHD